MVFNWDRVGWVSVSSGCAVESKPRTLGVREVGSSLRARGNTSGRKAFELLAGCLLCNTSCGLLWCQVREASSVVFTVVALG